MLLEERFPFSFPFRGLNACFERYYLPDTLSINFSIRAALSCFILLVT